MPEKGQCSCAELKPARLPRKPAEFVKVEKAMRANAKEAGFPASRVYVHVEEDGWYISDNWEGGMSTMIRRHSGIWVYRDAASGTDFPMPGGFGEAMANAACAFTG